MRQEIVCLMLLVLLLAGCCCFTPPTPDNGNATNGTTPGITPGTNASSIDNALASYKAKLNSGLGEISNANWVAAENDFSQAKQVLVQADLSGATPEQQQKVSDGIATAEYMKKMSHLMGGLGALDFSAVEGTDDLCVMNASLRTVQTQLEGVAQEARDLGDPPASIYIETGISPDDMAELTKMIDMLEDMDQPLLFVIDAADGGCIMQEEILPAIDATDDAATRTALTGKMAELEAVRAKFQSAYTGCRNFVSQKKELAQMMDITYGTCAEMSTGIESIDTLEALVNGTAIPGTNLLPPDQQNQSYVPTSTSEVFYILYDWKDITKPIDPFDPAVVYTTSEIVHPFGSGDRTWEQAEAIFNYSRDEIIYVQTPIAKNQHILRPAATIQAKRGNCADKSVLLASMFMDVGFPVKVVLEDTDHSTTWYESTGSEFSPDHMLLAVEVEDEWYAADPACLDCPLGEPGFPNGTFYLIDVPEP